METQSESNPQSRVEKTEQDVKTVTESNDRSTDVEAREQRIEPYSDEDPYRPARIAALRDETQMVCNTVHAEATGFQELNGKQLRDLQSDADERARWPKARQDAFDGILRLGRKTPGRSERIL